MNGRWSWNKRGLGSALSTSSSGVLAQERVKYSATWYYDPEMAQRGDRQALTGILNLEAEDNKLEEVQVMVQNGVLSWIRTGNRPSRNTQRPAYVLQDARIKDLNLANNQPSTERHTSQLHIDSLETAPAGYSFEVILGNGKKFMFHAQDQEIQQRWLLTLRDNSLLHLREKMEDSLKKMELMDANLREAYQQKAQLEREAKDQKAMFHARKASIEHEKVVVEERWEETKQKERLFEEAYREAEAKAKNLKNNLEEQEYQLRQQIAEVNRKWADTNRRLQEESESRIQKIALEAKDYQFRLGQATDEIQGLREKNSRLEEVVQKSSADLMAAKSQLNLRENEADSSRKEAQQAILQLKERTTVSERECRELEAKVQSTERILLRVEQARDALERELERRKSQLVALQQREREAQKQAANLSGQLEVQREEQRRYTQSLKESVQEKDQQILDLHRRNGELEAHYELIKMELVSRDMLRRQNSDMSMEKMMDMERQLNLAHKKIQELDEENRSYSEQYDNQLEGLKAENIRLRQKIKELEATIENQRQLCERANELVQSLKEDLKEKEIQLVKVRQSQQQENEMHKQQIHRLESDLELQHKQAEERFEEVKMEMERERQMLEMEADNLMREQSETLLSNFAQLLLELVDLAGYEYHQPDILQEEEIMNQIGGVVRELISEREDLTKSLGHLEGIIQQEREKSKKIQYDAMMYIQQMGGEMFNAKNMRRVVSEKTVRDNSVPRSKSRSRNPTPELILEEEMQERRSAGSSTGRVEQALLGQSQSQLLPPLGPPQMHLAGHQTPQKSPSRKSRSRRQSSFDLSHGRAATPQGHMIQQAMEEQFSQQQQQAGINSQIQNLIQQAQMSMNKQGSGSLDSRKKSPLKKRSSKRHSNEGPSSKHRSSPKPKSPSPHKQEHSSKAQLAVSDKATVLDNEDEEEIASTQVSQENVSSNSNVTGGIQPVAQPILLEEPMQQESKSVESPQAKDAEAKEKEQEVSESSQVKSSVEKERSQVKSSVEKESSQVKTSVVEESSQVKTSVEKQKRLIEAQQKQLKPAPRISKKESFGFQKEVLKKEATVTQQQQEQLHQQPPKPTTSAKQPDEKGESVPEFTRSGSVAAKIGKFGSMISHSSSQALPSPRTLSIRKTVKTKSDVKEKLRTISNQKGALEDELYRNTNQVRDLKVKLKQVSMRLKEPDLSQDEVKKLQVEEGSIKEALEFAKDSVKQTQSKIDERDISAKSLSKHEKTASTPALPDVERERGSPGATTRSQVATRQESDRISDSSNK